MPSLSKRQSKQRITNSSSSTCIENQKRYVPEKRRRKRKGRREKDWNFEDEDERTMTPIGGSTVVGVVVGNTGLFVSKCAQSADLGVMYIYI